MKKHKKHFFNSRLSKEEEAAYQAAEDLVARYSHGTWVASQEKIQQVREVYEALALAMADQNVEVMLKLNEPFSWISCISVVGSWIIFENRDVLLPVLGLANNVEIIARKDHKAEVNFTFYGTSVKVSE